MEKTAWHDRLALVIAIASFLIQIGLAFYWTGGVTARLEQTERTAERQGQEIDALRKIDREHDVNLSAINAQYTEIIARLGRLDAQRNPSR